MVIQSTSNEKIKKLRALYKDRKNRYQHGEFVAEGTIISKDLSDENICQIFIRESEAANASFFNPDKTVFVKNEIFDSVADTKTPSGVIVTLKIPSPQKVSGDKVLLLCGLGDAGNVGTIIRTACARGIKTVICVDTADPYSPKAVRASMGGIVKTNIISTDYDQALKMLKDYDIVALDMGGICIYDYKKSGKIAIAIGNEAHGIPDIVRDSSAEVVAIPMVEDGVESLNAAISAGIAMYLID